MWKALRCERFERNLCTKNRNNCFRCCCCCYCCSEYYTYLTFIFEFSEPRNIVCINVHVLAAFCVVDCFLLLLLLSIFSRQLMQRSFSTLLLRFVCSIYPFFVLKSFCAGFISLLFASFSFFSFFPFSRLNTHKVIEQFVWLHFLYRSLLFFKFNAIVAFVVLFVLLATFCLQRCLQSGRAGEWEYINMFVFVCRLDANQSLVMPHLLTVHSRLTVHQLICLSTKCVHKVFLFTFKHTYTYAYVHIIYM